MRAKVLAVPLLLGPGIVALFSGGYSDTARTAAGVAAWLLLAATAVALPRPLPRGKPAIAALAALVALTVWTAASLVWAPLREPRSEEHTSELQSQSNLASRLVLEQTNSPPPDRSRKAA